MSLKILKKYQKKYKPDLVSLFDTFKNSAYRIETLDTYHIDGDEWNSFNYYKNGLLIPTEFNNYWVNELKKWTFSGKYIERIRIVGKELNEYMKFEFEMGYLKNESAGEKILVINEDKYKKFLEEETKGDYWIFDEEILFKMNYDTEGRFLGGSLISEENVIKKCLDFYFKLKNESIEFIEIVKQIRNSKIRIEW